MRPKILAIQFRINKLMIATERASIEREAGVYTDITFIDVLDDGNDWGNPEKMMLGYDGVILGGSGDFDFDGNRPADDESRIMTYSILNKLRLLFQYIFDNDIPTLGICYGHQLLGAFAGAQVRYDATQRKTCSHMVKLMVSQNDHFLFSDLPDSFPAHYAHKDTLDRVPEGAVLVLEGGDRCKVAALQYRNNIYSTQFHPELNYKDAVERMKNSPGYLPEGIITEEIFLDNPDSNKIMQNFSKFVAQQAEFKKEQSVVSEVVAEMAEGV
ncbi:type 1 glutamine amidotransferase [Candidatus Nomurabacteria bacterium]|nr:type 1 glutamine amidotransferase [Candidatus Kaiserbacteria bacterium]MCB9814563.1 type 1 glutamine amidotransferase [Candidatus Nomurabacteria bacterium]